MNKKIISISIIIIILSFCINPILHLKNEATRSSDIKNFLNNKAYNNIDPAQVRLFKNINSKNNLFDVSPVIENYIIKSISAVEAKVNNTNPLSIYVGNDLYVDNITSISYLMYSDDILGIYNSLTDKDVAEYKNNTFINNMLNDLKSKLEHSGQNNLKNWFVKYEKQEIDLLYGCKLIITPPKIEKIEEIKEVTNVKLSKSGVDDYVMKADLTYLDYNNVTKNTSINIYINDDIMTVDAQHLFYKLTKGSIKIENTNSVDIQTFLNDNNGVKYIDSSESYENFNNRIIKELGVDNINDLPETVVKVHESNLINIILCILYLLLFVLILILNNGKYKLLVLIPIAVSLIFAKPIFADMTRKLELKNFYNGKNGFAYWNIDKETINEYKDSINLVNLTNNRNIEYDISDIISDYINKMTLFYRNRLEHVESFDAKNDPTITKVMLTEDLSFLNEQFMNLSEDIKSFESDLVTMLEKKFIHKSSSPSWDWYISKNTAELNGKKDLDSYIIDLPFNCKFIFACPEAVRNNIKVVDVDLSQLDKNDPLSTVYLICDDNTKKEIHISFKNTKGLNKNIMTLDVNDGILFNKRERAYCEIKNSD